MNRAAAEVQLPPRAPPLRREIASRIAAPEASRSAVKLAASACPPPNAALQSNEFAAKATSAAAVARTTRTAALCRNAARSASRPPAARSDLGTAQVGVAAHRLLVEIGQRDRLLGLHRALAHLGVKRLLHPLGQVARLVLDAGQHPFQRVPGNDL